MSKLNDVELGEALRTARIKAGLSQIQLAVKAGVSVGSIGLAERFGFASERTAERVAAALGVKFTDLVARPPTSAKRAGVEH